MMATAQSTSTSASLVIGIDVGSTTVKAVVMNPESLDVLWQDYRRHNTRQAETTLAFLQDIMVAFPDHGPQSLRLFITGSGGGALADATGAKFVQEVNAVTLAVEARHPDVGSVIELGGQDAKIIIFKERSSGERSTLTSMNDKCASGTGATIDKCLIKVGMPQAELGTLSFDAASLHHIAAKCGVFAETDVVNLVKSGIPAPEIMCSLADAIVAQNLSVLTRGNTLRHKVCLLGGPNTYLPFLQACWRMRIPETWEERGYDYPKDIPLEELIFVPNDSLYYAAIGSVLYGLREPATVGAFRGIEPLIAYVQTGRKARLGDDAGPPLVHSQEELDAFLAEYTIPTYEPPVFKPGEHVQAVIGLDGGSTSSKAVLVGPDGDILRKSYILSKGNPIQDTKDMLRQLRESVTEQGATLEILGFGATGYAADVLEESLSADVNIVETIAHMMSAVHFFGDVDVICDIGGQDIKVLFMANGTVQNFQLSNQCSAGNGMLLQAMAGQFGVPVTEYAETAFRATLTPNFSYGCAVFLDSDRVNFQREGFAKEELLAGLALVLPKNVWQYVVQIPRMASLGRRFVLQGGTQYNQAALKAQVDYIKARVPNAEVFVHPHAGEAGAIGAAMETLRKVKPGASTFVGLDAAIDLTYTTRTDEETRCNFCENHCHRTFIDTRTPNGRTSRYISGFACEKGTVESVDALRDMQRAWAKHRKSVPNLIDDGAKSLFRQIYTPAPQPEAGTWIDDVEVRVGFLGRIKHTPVRRGFKRSSVEDHAYRAKLRIGIPRVLNIWSTGPFWRAYLEATGVNMRGVVFSDVTTEENFQEGAKYGSVDPCFPSKAAQSHVHNLLFHKHTDRRPLNAIFFPCITHVSIPLKGVVDTAACPIVAGTPEVIKAAFTKETDFFADRGIRYMAPAVTMNEPNLLKKQLFRAFGDLLRCTEDESDFAVDEAWKAVEAVEARMQAKGRAILEEVQREDRIAILMIGRPYHLDPGINHQILDGFQALGYPILSELSLPRDEAWWRPFFKQDEVFNVSDVWPENFSANSSMKVWAAKCASRHPNIAVVDLSSFKCGHDAPTYGIIHEIIAHSKTPYVAFHDIDANKPGGSIKIRVKTFAYTLSRYAEELVGRREKDEALANAMMLERARLGLSQPRVPGT